MEAEDETLFMIGDNSAERSAEGLLRPELLLEVPVLLDDPDLEPFEGPDPAEACC